MMTRNPRVLIIGSGNAAQRHLGYLRQGFPQAHVTLWSESRGGEPDLRKLGADRVVSMPEDARAARAELVIVANLASRHVPAALEVLESATHVLVEKPLATDLAEADQLLRACADRRVATMTGYSLRFHPSLRFVSNALHRGELGELLSVRAEVGQHLADWRPGRNPRSTGSARRAAGGGVLLELSHEMDYLLWLVGQVDSVTCRTRKAGEVTIDAEDVAVVMMVHANGITSTAHLNMLQRPATRTCDFICSQGVLHCDLVRGEVRTAPGMELLHQDLEGAHGIQEAMVTHFIRQAMTGGTLEPSGAEGRAALAVALAAGQAASERDWVSVE